MANYATKHFFYAKYGKTKNDLNKIEAFLDDNFSLLCKQVW